MNASIERTQRLYKTIGKLIIASAIAVAVVFMVAFFYFEAQSPAYLFINDTDNEAHLGLIGGTSPFVHVDLLPGEKEKMDMPFWWGEPQMPRDADGQSLKPLLNLVVFKVYYVSSFPADWVD
jgi:hypothetical protein